MSAYAALIIAITVIAMLLAALRHEHRKVRELRRAVKASRKSWWLS